MNDITLVPIGRIHTPWQTLADCPHNVRQSEQTATIELYPQYAAGLTALKAREIDLLYWFDQAPRDVLESINPHDQQLKGVFAMRSPHRPNPIALARVEVLAIEGNRLTVSALDCLDGTLLLDIKPAY